MRATPLAGPRLAYRPNRTFEAPPPYIHTMTHTAKPRAIEFSGDITALAVTLGMAVDDITASIAALIERGHLMQISHGTYRLFPKPTL
jgi:hypothetical protein